MSRLQIIWKNFLTTIISNTFNEFLSSEQIEERVNWIMSIIHTINPDKLYKNLLFIMNNNSLSEIAIGYKIHFLLDDDYRVLFMDPYSEEFDKNPNLIESDKNILDEYIHNMMIVINHHIEMMIINGNDEKTDDLNKAILELSTSNKLPFHQKIPSKLVKDGIFTYRMSFGQLLYTVAFNQNPFSCNNCDENLITNITESYSHRLEAMKALKVTWPTGIPLKYVKSTKIF